MEIIFKNRTNKIEAAEIINGNIKITIKGEDARELARMSLDERFSLDKYIEKLFSNT